MVALIKALFSAALLSWLVATFAKGGGARGGLINVQSYILAGTQIQFSWNLFFVAVLFWWAIFAMME